MSKCCNFCKKDSFINNVVLIESPDKRVHICEGCIIEAARTLRSYHLNKNSEAPTAGTVEASNLSETTE